MVGDNGGVEAAVLPFADGELHHSNSCTVGAMLRNARLASRLSLDAVADRTRIRACYIEALEQGQMARFAAPIYAIGFARNFAQALGLDAEWVAAEMRAYIANDTTATWRRSGWMS